MEPRPLKKPESTVQGEPIYSDGVKTYVISRAKMNREGLQVPTDEKELVEFFKQHADGQLDDQKTVPTHTTYRGG